MKKLLFMLLSVLCCTISVGQESYEQLLKEYCKQMKSTSQLVNKEKMTPMLQEVNKKLLSDKDLKRSEQLIEEYITSQMEDDVMANILLPMFKEAVSEQELRELMTMMGTKEGKQWNVNNEKSMAAAGTVVALTSMGVMLDDGKEGMEDIGIDEKCPKSYQELFDKYSKCCRYDEILSTTMQAMMSASLSEMGSNKKAKEMMEKYMGYLKKNMRTIMMNCAFETMTEGDLKFGISLFEKPSYQRIVDATMKLVDDLPKLGLTMVEGYVSWLQEKKGITLKD